MIVNDTKEKILPVMEYILYNLLIQKEFDADFP